MTTTRFHTWKKSDGTAYVGPPIEDKWTAHRMDIDIFAMETGFHNGPRCLTCLGVWCHHCDPDIYKKYCPGIPEGDARSEYNQPKSSS